MAETKKVMVCKKCSGFDVSELKGMIKSKHYSTGCIDKCVKSHHKLEGKVYGYLDGKFVVCDTKEEFFEKISELQLKAPKDK